MVSASQQEIDHPTPTRMLSRPTTVVQDLGICAACVFQGVCDDRQVIEMPASVDGGSDVDHGGR
jgi:hypothetical protein